MFFIWRRPELTRRVFAQIAAARPKVLIIVADGAADGDGATERRCAATRAVVERIDWPCEVHRDYAVRNLGLRARLESGLDFVFSLTESAILLEDDTLPHSSFFEYAQDLLRFYADDERIGCISGYKPPGTCVDAPSSFTCTSYPVVWGWATWRRVWRAHDRKLLSWPQAKNDQLMLSVTGSAQAAAFWTLRFDRQHGGDPKSYATGFIYNFLAKGLRCIVPATNLISNIGFGDDATHTLDAASPHVNLHTAAMTWPLMPPAKLDPRPLDRHIEQTFFSGDPMAYPATSVGTIARSDHHSDDPVSAPAAATARGSILA